MKQNNNNGILVGTLIGLVIALLIVVLLFATETISFDTKNSNNEKTSSNGNVINDKTSDNGDDSNEFPLNNLSVSEVTFNNENISVLDMIQESIHISSSGISSINPLYDYNISLLLSGKVRISTVGMSSENNQEHESEILSNVSNVVDIIQFSIAGIPEEQLIYMLLSNGDVYYYKVGDSINKKYTATKVENVSNVKKLFIYNYPTKKNAGGSWSIVAIKDNNETVALNTEGV